jgi:hypothetical protein
MIEQDELHIVGRAFEWLSVQIVELIFGMRKTKTPEIEELYQKVQQHRQRRGLRTRVN